MGRGIWYTPEEDQLLLNVAYDNDALSYTDMAKIAQRYGICAERKTEALSQHIRSLMTPTPEEIQQIEEYRANRIEGEKTKEKYKELMHILIDLSTVYGGYALHLDYKAINNWLWRNETELVRAKLEAHEYEEAANEAK